MLDLHRHDERSAFDGFGKTNEIIEQAKKLEYTALGISNHGDMSVLVDHYYQCKENGIKPVLGCEVYFQPSFKEVRTSFHLCLFVKNLKGYENLNRIIAFASKKQFYYKPIVTYELLEKYGEGLICTSACIGGFISKMLMNDESLKAIKSARRFKSIFGDDFYIEIQPYKLSEKGLQEKINEKLIALANRFDIKCILTSDSHFISSSDFDTYLKMHGVGGHAELGKQYKERFMPSESGILCRFDKMHRDLFRSKKYSIIFGKAMIKNLQEIEDKVDDEILEKLKMRLPVFEKGIDSDSLFWDKIADGLKKKGKYTKKYVKRCREEWEIICQNGYADYFLIVADFINYAKKKRIEVGTGRGSICNSIVAYATGITEVDSIFFNLDFRRFMRLDKSQMPDCDTDFETDGRDEVIDYLISKYPKNSVRICSYSLYKPDVALGDLFKVCGLALCDKKDPDKHWRDAEIKEEQQRIIKIVKSHINKTTGKFDYSKASEDKLIQEIDEKYDNIIMHFSKLYMKFKFYGKHAAGVAITGGNILNYTAIMRNGKDKKGNPAYTTVYDLGDCERAGIIKFDFLGLRTMSMLKELRNLCNKPHKFDYDYLTDEAIMEQFSLGNTDGIFQFGSEGGKSVLRGIHADCYQDVIAANALNRPGPLSMGMVDQYADNKQKFLDGEITEKSSIFYEYAKDTYGTFVFQEQIMLMVTGFAGMSWNEADQMLKILKHVETVQKMKADPNSLLYELQSKFIKGCKKRGVSKGEAKEIFESLLVYAFNQGHAVGYALISIEMMYFKVYCPHEFWYIVLKYANENDYRLLASKAIRNGVVILPPHINGSALHSLIEVEGEKCVLEGLSHHKGVGEKAGKLIEQEREENGDFLNIDDFLDRIEPYKRIVNKKSLETLKTYGAIDFNKNRYFAMVSKYNSELHAISVR